MKFSFRSTLLLLFLLVIFPADTIYSQKKDSDSVKKDSVSEIKKVTYQKKDSLSVKKDSVKLKPKPVVKKKLPVKKVKEESFMDKVQKIIELRRSFDVTSETSKPALLSFRKDNDEKSVFNMDMAISYKGFRYGVWGISPSIQFDYSSRNKDQLEKLKGGFDVYYKLYEYDGGSGRIEPAISFSKDFYSKIEQFETSLDFVPRFPKFFIPVLNVSDIKFKYDGKDNRWIFGFNPVIGSTFKRTYGGRKNLNQTEYYGTLAASISLRRYYLLFEIYGRYEDEFRKDTNSRYKYDATATLYFDDKERSSINIRFDQEQKDKSQRKRFTIGFGIKL